MKNQILLFALTALFSVAAFAQGNAFSFQGKLNDGANPANGRYDLEFKLFDAITGGNQVGSTVARPGTTLINGVFSTTLDFGAAAFQNPNTIFIEIAVKPFNSTNAFTILGPRQQLTVVPFAARSQNSAQLGGIAANEYVTRTLGDQSYIKNSTAPQDGNFNVQGNGTVGGNFGVGGAATSKFQVFGNAKITAPFPKLTLNETRVSNADAEIVNQDGELSFSLNSTTRMWIRNNGTVAVGGFSLPATNSIFQVVGDVDVGGKLEMYGNTKQGTAYNGLPKAMMYVTQNGTITRCFNGVTGVTGVNCGFTVTRESNGGYRINLGFNVLGLYPVATGTGGNPATAEIIELSGSGGTRVEVFIGSGSTTGTSAPFTMILF